jgi:uncharacterized Tic20 family protein
MEDRPLNSSIRRKAARCHLASLIWLPIEIVLFMLISNNIQDLVWFSISIFAFPLIAMVLGSLLTILIWKANKATHPFVDRSGRSAINSILSYTLYLLIISTLIGVNCGIPMIPLILPAVQLPIGMIMFCFFPALLFGNFCVTIDRAIAAWNGKVRDNPFVIKFLTEIQ